jgi:hypothetical protein
MRIRLLTLVVMAGCSKSVDIGPSQANTLTKRISNTRDLDLLFVIDNSSSTADKQATFNANFSTFIQTLDGFPGGRPNVHIGVVTSTVDIGATGFAGADGAAGCPSPDPAEDGLLQNQPGANSSPGCTGPTDQYISDIANPDGTRTTNYTGDLADTFSCIASVGASGCGFEAQLEGMKRALSGYRPENAGFLRSDAYLGVVILTDEDDCSAQDPSIFSLPAEQVGGLNDFRCQPLFAYTCDTPISATEPGTYTGCTPTTGSGAYLADPASYVQFLAGIKDPSQTVVATIAGDPQTTITTGPLTLNGATQSMALQPSCTATVNGDAAIARPANRLDAFRAGFDPYEHGVFETVCQSDYSNALTQIGAKLFTMMSDCLEGAVDTTDTQPSNPGVQPACDVTMRVGFGGSDEHDVSLQACKMLDATTPDPADASPCWWVESSPSCATDTGLALQVQGESTAPGTVVDATCLKQH